MEFSHHKKNIVSKNPEIIVSTVLGAFLLIYLILRIFTVAITDDEYMTLYYHVKYGYLSILTTGNPNLDWTANNHVLNSLCMKAGIGLFGENDWAVRWQCIAAFIVSYYFMRKILLYFTTDWWRVTIYISIFFLNAYLLEFYSLARGYCLSMAGWTMAMYYLVKFTEKKEKNTLSLSLLGLFIAVWGNFSAIYFLVLFGSIFLFEIYKIRPLRNARKYFYILVGSYCLIALIIALPLYRTLQSTEIVSGGSSSLFKDYIVSYFDRYVSSNYRIGKEDLVGWGLRQKQIYAGFFTVIWLLMQFFSWQVASSQIIKRIQLLTLFQSIGLVVLFKLFYIGFHTPYPINRATLLFSFPMILCGITAFEQVVNRFKWVQLSFFILIPFLIWHTYFSFNLKNSIEWWRAGDAKEVLKFLKQEYQKQKRIKPISLGAEPWQFCGLAFYGDTVYKDYIKVNWRTISGNETDEYLFVPKEMEAQRIKNYIPVQEFEHGFLFIRLDK